MTGALRVEVHQAMRQSFGNNPTLRFTVHGIESLRLPVPLTAFRQGGGARFWAFDLRTKLTRDEQRALDKALDEAWERSQEPRCAACGSECGCEPAGRFE